MSQLSIFDILPDRQQCAYERFLDLATKLTQEGYKSYCPDWWRSRQHDLLYPGHHAAKDHADWEAKNFAQTNWPTIWKKFNKEFLGGLGGDS